jgi:hypothetical protein
VQSIETHALTPRASGRWIRSRHRQDDRERARPRRSLGPPRFNRKARLDDPRETPAAEGATAEAVGVQPGTPVDDVDRAPRPRALDPRLLAEATQQLHLPQLAGPGRNGRSRSLPRSQQHGHRRQQQRGDRSRGDDLARGPRRSRPAQTGTAQSTTAPRRARRRASSSRTASRSGRTR